LESLTPIKRLEVLEIIECKICKNIPDYKFADKLHKKEQLPEEVGQLKVIGGYEHDCQIRKCTLCGTYYRYYYDHDSESGVGYGYTDEFIKRITPERTQELMNAVIRAYPQLPLEELKQELDYLKKKRSGGKLI
jgi:hypothetical protein